MSLNGALSIASNALQLYSLGIQIAGNNIANASTPGYIREQLRVYPSAPYAVGTVLVGTGAQAAGVRQVFDRFLEDRIHTANSDYSAAAIRSQTYSQLESIVGELGEQDLSSSLNRFIQAVQNAANQPDDAALRNIVVQQASQFAFDAVSLRQRVAGLRDAYSDQMRALTEEANALINEISALNPQISRLEANGLDLSEAGPLRVQRLNALNRLSEILPIRVHEQASGSIDVFTDNDFLILGGYTQQLEAVLAPTESGLAEINVQTSLTRATVGRGGGELGGLIESRDQILNGYLNELDKFVGAVIFEFNKFHASGEGLIGYTNVTSSNFVNSTTAALNQAGLAFSPEHGGFEIKVRNTATGVEETHQIAINLDGIGADTSLEDLRAAMNSLGQVTAEITSENKLRITTTAGYEVRFQNDTSGVLAALGINTFFTGHSSDDIAVNGLIASDHRYFASGQGGGAADNRNALELAQFIDRPLNSLKGLTIDKFQTSLVTQIAQAASAEKAMAEGSRGFRDSLMVQREQKSGVSIDEEAIQLLNLQRNYQAAARIITTIDQLMNTLLQM